MQNAVLTIMVFAPSLQGSQNAEDTMLQQEFLTSVVAQHSSTMTMLKLIHCLVPEAP